MTNPPGVPFWPYTTGSAKIHLEDDTNNRTSLDEVARGRVASFNDRSSLKVLLPVRMELLPLFRAGYCVRAINAALFHCFTLAGVFKELYKGPLLSVVNIPIHSQSSNFCQETFILELWLNLACHKLSLYHYRLLFSCTQAHPMLIVFPVLSSITLLQLSPTLWSRPYIQITINPLSALVALGLSYLPGG